MKVLQDLLGLISRNLFIKKNAIEQEDVLFIAKRENSNSDTLNYGSRALKMKDFSEYIADSVPAGPQGPAGAAGPAGPQGDPGPAGPVGAAGLNFVGPFDNTIGYSQGDVVFFGGSSYVAKFAIPAPTPPAVLPDPPNTDWDFLALQGLEGPPGPGGYSVSDAGRVSTGGSTSEFLFRSLLIPANSFSLGDIFHIEAMFLKIAGHSFEYKCYINTANTLTGATLLWQTDFQSSRRYMNTVYSLVIDRAGPGDTTTGGSLNNNAITSGFSQYGNSGKNHAIDWSVDQYILIAGINSSAVNSTTNVGAKIW